MLPLLRLWLARRLCPPDHEILRRVPDPVSGEPWITAWTETWQRQARHCEERRQARRPVGPTEAEVTASEAELQDWDDEYSDDKKAMAS